MPPKEFIQKHKAAVDYHNGKTVCMVSIDNAEKAVELAEYNLAKELLKMRQSAIYEYLEHIIYNFENKSTHE